MPTGMPSEDASRAPRARASTLTGSPWRDQLGDGEIALPQGGSEVTVRQRAEIAHVLHGERPIEPVDALEVGAYRRGERLLLVEGAPGREAHDDERQCDDDEESGREGQAMRRSCVTQHGRRL